MCSLCERETNFFFVETILSKKNPQKEQSFSTQKLLAKEQSFFFSPFFSSSLLRKKNDHIFETKVHLVLTQLRERSVDDTNTTYSE